MNPITFLKAAYIVAWVVYLGYLGRILLRMRRVGDEGVAAQPIELPLKQSTTEARRHRGKLGL
jgi:hypothetical protein